MKKIAKRIVVLFFSCLLLLTSAGLGMLVGCDKGEISYDNMVISNFADYSSLGVGKLYSEPVEQTASIKTIKAKADNGNHYGHYLLGIKKNGEIEKVKFKDENGKEIEQKMYISDFVACKKFSFIGFSEGKGQVNNDGLNFTSTNIYVMDNVSGKLYSLDYFEYITLYTAGAGSWEHDGCMQTSNSIYVASYDIYRLSIDNGNLKIEEWIKLEVSEIFRPAFSDIYENIFMVHRDTHDWYVLSYKTRELKKIDLGYGYTLVDGYEPLSPWIAKNGRVYINPAFDLNNWDENGQPIQVSNGKVFNENGITEDALYIPEKVDVSDNSCIKKENNISYYYQQGKITKIEYIDEEKYNVKSILLENYSSEYAVANDKIYFLENEEIYYCEIETGKKTSVTSDYLFSSIRSNNLGEVFFTAIDNKMNTVNGIIYADGTISTEVKENTYDMAIVKPLN